MATETFPLPEDSLGFDAATGRYQESAALALFMIVSGLIEKRTAIHSASIVLLNSNLSRIPFLIALSRRTIAVIRQNTAIGVVFNRCVSGAGRANA